MVFGLLDSKSKATEKQVENGTPGVNADEELLRQLGYEQVYTILYTTYIFLFLHEWSLTHLHMHA